MLTAPSESRGSDTRRLRRPTIKPKKLETKVIHKPITPSTTKDNKRGWESRVSGRSSGVHSDAAVWFRDFAEPWTGPERTRSKGSVQIQGGLNHEPDLLFGICTELWGKDAHTHLQIIMRHSACLGFLGLVKAAFWGTYLM